MNFNVSSTCPKVSINTLNQQHWVERDMLLMHACFQIIEDFHRTIDQSKLFSMPEQIQQVFSETIQWWQKRKGMELNDELDYTEESNQESEDNKVLLNAILLRKYLI